MPTADPAMPAADPAMPIARIVAGSDPIVVADGTLLRLGRYEQSGADLWIVGPGGERVLIEGYFALSAPPVIVGPSGIRITPDLVDALLVSQTPGQYAQGSVTEGAAAVGIIETVEGSAYVTHLDGTTEELRVDSELYQGDVIQTEEGSSIGFVLADGTAVAMDQGARMILDELVYDPSQGEGSLSMSLLQGLFTMASGDVAALDADAMTVRTPRALAAIRGTDPGFQIEVGTDTELYYNLPNKETGTFGYFVVTILETGDRIDVGEPWDVVRLGPAGDITKPDIDPRDIAALFNTLQEIKPVTGAHQGADAEALAGLAPAAGGENPLGGPIQVTLGLDLALILSVFEPPNQLGAAPGSADLIALGAIAPAGDDDDVIAALPPAATLAGFFLPDAGGVFFGTDGPDLIFGGAGIDEIFGLGGDDVIFGGPGGDIIDGGADDDVIDGGEDADVLDGGSGDDALLGGAGDDLLIGGSGLGNDLIVGGPGTDLLTYESVLEGGVTVDLALGIADDGQGGVDEISEVENVIGSGGNDLIIGSDSSNVLDGALGADRIEGNGGDDTLIGGPPLGGDLVLAKGGAADWAAADITLSALAADGSQAALVFANNGVGVAGGRLTQIEHSNDGTSETLLVQFDLAPVTRATVTISNLIPDENDGEQGMWRAFDSDGIEIASDVFGPDAVDGGGKGAFTIDGIGQFQSLAFTALPYVGQPDPIDSSDYFLTSVEYLAFPEGADLGDTLLGGPGDDVLDGGGGPDLLVGGPGDDTLGGGVDPTIFGYASPLDGTTVAENVLAVPAGDLITDYKKAIDAFAFANGAFGFGDFVGNAEQGASFFAVAGYNGANSGAPAGTPHFIFDPEAGVLAFDFDSTAPGYQTMATVDETGGGATVTAAEITIVDPSALA